MKNHLDISSKEMERAMHKADALEREILKQGLHCTKTSCQWLMAANVYNKIIAEKR